MSENILLMMTKKEQFMAFVMAGAVARDLGSDTTDAQAITHMANQIPDASIPDNVMNAAKVYLAFFYDTGKRPYRWMLKREPIHFPPAEA